jgi:hypothetical protein
MMSLLHKHHNKDIMSYAHFFYTAKVNRISLKIIVEVRDVLISSPCQRQCELLPSLGVLSSVVR